MKSPRHTTASGSFLQNLFWLSLAVTAGVFLVKQEVEVDMSGRNIKTLEKEIIELQIRIVNSNIEIGELTTFPQVSLLAEKIGLQTPKSKPKIVNTDFTELPLEMQKSFVPVSPESAEVK